ncbi:unnamed protein product [Lactuca virosa]|uniref:Uncharacterized protein n=1 Tax=Lactuca virosa TaxID=75947 RepID=A0AAU9LF62_9ASTR|nr:unnamed protein product [Lactuca virosa]
MMNATFRIIFFVILVLTIASGVQYDKLEKNNIVDRRNHIPKEMLDTIVVKICRMTSDCNGFNCPPNYVATCLDLYCVCTKQ